MTSKIQICEKDVFRVTGAGAIWMTVRRNAQTGGWMLSTAYPTQAYCYAVSSVEFFASLEEIESKLRWWDGLVAIAADQVNVLAAQAVLRKAEYDIERSPKLQAPAIELLDRDVFYMTVSAYRSPYTLRTDSCPETHGVWTKIVATVAPGVPSWHLYTTYTTFVETSELLSGKWADLLEDFCKQPAS